MSKKIIWIIAIAVLGVIGFWVYGGYNELVAQEENVESAWAQVENEYQRRGDAIPQFVSAVKAAAAHEHNTMTEVMEARAKATQITIDPSHVTAEQLAAYQQAQGELSQAMGRLMAVSEAYPELKANENYLRLMSQLEGSQNRCTVARSVFNEQARAFNVLVRRFPTNILANLFGFEKKPYFEAEAEAAKNPDVDLMY